MQCPHCQAENQNGLFCVKCGKQLVDDLPSTKPPADGDETLIIGEAAETPAHEESTALASTSPRNKKLIALACGVLLALVIGIFALQHFFGDAAVQKNDANSNIEKADIVSPEDGVVADTIVGHWRHYNEGITIEKIGADHYRWKSGEAVYEIRFKDNQYVLTSESDRYFFTLEGPDRLKLQNSADADGRLVKKPLFAKGYVAGRIGQDGTPAKNLHVNKDAFDIVGRSYGELAGMYGPGAVSVISDTQYIVFRGPGGNFAVQFTGNTVPLAKEGQEEYKIVKLTNGNTTPSEGNNTHGDTTTPQTPPPANNNNNNNTNNTTPSEKDKEKEEKKDYKLEIPNMPTFPSNSAIATGVVWADLGFVIANAPQTLTVEDLSAILKTPLEVGEAPGNASGYTFYGMDEGYFAGTITIGNHQFRLSGYGKNALNKDKTTIFIEQLS